MNTVDVTASKHYSVVIGDNLLTNLGIYLQSICKHCKIAIISDSNVWPLYGDAVTDSLARNKYDFVSFVFPAGEEHKNAATYISILNFLAENQITRTDCIIALGGGVVGDITGFAAATYLRGTPYIQIPTTLLAMVDSSVGGKTAIDLAAGKNLAGAFNQPALVICDLNALNTLPETVFLDGCAEIIKYGVLYDPVLFSHLAEKGPDFDREYVVSRCVELKRNVVSCDEFDTGLRQKLNLGHTIGHGIEAQSNFNISHGKAVAIGMNIITKAAVSYGICPETLYQQIQRITDKFKLPNHTTYSADALFHSALSDKKRAGTNVTLIVPVDIGNCILRKTPINELKSFIEAGL